MSNTSNNGLTLAEQLAAVQAENAKLKADAAKKQTFNLKVSEKGAISIYGLGRFPTTLYRQQMERVLDKADEIRAFIAANASRLSVKE